MKNSTNILIVGANFINKGAEAMLKTVQQQLNKKCSNAVFYMICREEEKELAVKNNFVPIYDDSSPLTQQIRSLKWRVRGRLFKIFLKKNQPYVFHFPFNTIQKTINKLDMVIDISGFAYADSWGKPMMSETIKLMDFCKKHYGSKFYFLPQAWGSFNKPEVAEAAKEMLSKAENFYARDLVSQNYLANLLNRTKEEIPLLHDIVFSFEGTETTNPEKLLTSIGYSKSGRPLIGISPNFRVYEKDHKTGGENGYLQILVKLCNHCINKMNADVVLIPNEIFPYGMNHDDDRLLCRMLNDLLNRPDRCYIVDKYCSAEEIKGFISQLDLLVSSRFHALIFGLLHSVPVMAISWSHKYKELFSLFNLERFVMESDAMDSTSAIAIFDKLFEEQEEISSKISSNLEALKSKVDEMFTEIASNNSVAVV